MTQATVPEVASFPGAPSPSAPFDWHRRALDYDSFVYDWSQPGRFPTIAWDHTHYNMSSDTYKMPSYYADGRLGTDGAQEALGQIASVVGATLVGVDKSNQGGIDYVDMTSGPVEVEVTQASTSETQTVTIPPGSTILR